MKNILKCSYLQGSYHHQWKHWILPPKRALTNMNIWSLFKVLLHCEIFSATCLATPFATLVAGELHSVTGVVSQLFFLAWSVAQSRTLVYFSQRIAATFNTIAQCFTPPATFAAIFESRSLLEHAHFLISAILILAPSLPRPKMLQVAGENCSVTGLWFFRQLSLQRCCETSCRENCAV